MIALRRTGGMRMPQFREVLEVGDDGAFRMWRSVSMASALPSPIGRFAGQLPDDRRRELFTATGQAAGEGSRKWNIRPDSPIDQIEADGATATLGIHDSGDGGWATLAGLVRPMLKELTESPIAAIALEIDDGTRLVHKGTKALRLDFSKLTVRAFHWRGSGTEAQWTSVAKSADVVSAGPGWRLDLPFDHGFAIEEGDRVTVTVTFSVWDEDRLVAVGLQSP